MKTIKITRGRTVLVDDADYEYLIQHPWRCMTSVSGENYARTNVRDPKTERRSTLLMHRLILGLTNPKIQTDHRDGNGLNNQRENLRVVTHRKNHHGFRRKVKGCSSIYRGVCWHSQAEKWKAQIYQRKADGKHHCCFIGYFSIEADAARAYNNKAIEFGFFPEALNKIA